MASTIASQIEQSEIRQHQNTTPTMLATLYQYIIEQLRRNVLIRTSYLVLLTCLTACSSSKYISKQARQDILSDSNLTAAHVGISIYDASANKYIYNYQGDKYFIPASNTKLYTCYAAMKHLGDSLVGLEYDNFSDTAINVMATGDPSFLSDDFKKHPVLEFLKKENRSIYISKWNWKDDALGFGWTWDDYSSSDAAEKNIFPVHHNLVSIKLDSSHDKGEGITLKWKIKPGYFLDKVPTYFTLPLDVAKNIKYGDTNYRWKRLRNFDIEREIQQNRYRLIPSTSVFKSTEVPFHTDTINTALQILKADYGIKMNIGKLYDHNIYITVPAHLQWHKIYSQPTDSLLKIMMHRSDNFYAEQCLVMIGASKNGELGYSNKDVISHLLQSVYADLPQKPRWVDGCGLSRYNLSTPQDFVTVLKKMKTDFDWNRITTILATGGEGTLTNYYINLKDRIFAKTGTLSNNVALSGFLLTKHNKTIIFSVLVNNHMGSTTQIRKAVEKFLTSIAEKY